MTGHLAGCRRAGALARGLRRDLELALDRGERPPPAALRSALRSIDAALDLALRFDARSDPELAYRRGHARNVALVLRRTVEAWIGGGPAPAADLLPRAIGAARDLDGTIAWICRRALDIDVPAPARPWAASWSGRLLSLAATLLPPEARDDFVEDQCGNLAGARSRREWVVYLLGLLAATPRLAAAAALGRARW